MNIKSIKLTNYRNHLKKFIEFNENINVLVGSNGTGKTNILEAIHLLATTKSFRAKFDRDIINYDSQAALVEAKVLRQGDIDDLVVQIAQTPRSENTSTKKVKYNNLPKSLNNFSGYFYSVLFSPEDIETLTGAPGLRRKYINSILSQTDAGYKKALGNYTKTVRSRNKLLETIRETGTGQDQLPFWNNKLLEFGEILQNAREELIAHFNNHIDTNDNNTLLEDQNIYIEYNKNSIDTKRLLEYKDREIASKNTLIGPHRDDFTVLQNSKNIAQFGSRGEQRTAVFALKLAEIDFIKQSTSSTPVLLLDDIFSELDTSHKELVINLIKSSGQTIISSAEELDFLDFERVNVLRL